MSEAAPTSSTPSTPAAPAGPAASIRPAAPAAATSEPDRAAASATPPATSDTPPDKSEKTDAPASSPELTTDIVAGQGGVMTDEAGVITGELTLKTEVSGNDVVVRVQYKEADEWYAVTGAKTTVKDPSDAAAIHKIAVGILNRPEG
jgi:hypothetical protein